MSFNNNIKKPKLVESKLVNFYNNKIKARTLAVQLEKEQLEKEQINNVNNNIISEIPLHKKIFNNIMEFIKANYGFVLLTSLIIILLYIRYIEVTRRKQQLKDLNNKNNKYILDTDSESDSISDNYNK